MISFHGDPTIKEKYLKRVLNHQKLDHFVKGKTWDGTNGCAIGCTLENYNHEAYEEELGIPEWLARLEDRLFEGMGLEKSKTWPGLFLEVIPVGVDLEPIKGPFLVLVLESALDTFDHKKYSIIKKWIDRVIPLWKKGGPKKQLIAHAYAFDAFDAARAAAADGDDDYAAAYPDAARAAVAAAYTDDDYAAGAAAAYAADAAADAAYAADADGDAARTKKYDYFADELLRLLKGLKK